jgi:lipid II:glycine glycyltransferase (peptidoglycan interpeptide bridge formation enzyme)
MKRYGIRSHSLESHRKLWELMRKEGIAHLLITEYNGNVLAAWMLYRFRKTLHYPYGGSTRQNREVMPSYATMWEAIKFGKSCGCTIFDLWGCLGQTPRVDDAWAGLHRFKMAFSPSIYEYLGAYDIPSKP